LIPIPLTAVGAQGVPVSLVTAGNVPASAVYLGGIAFTQGGILYVVIA
jgi:hypothetical protein